MSHCARCDAADSPIAAAYAECLSTPEQRRAREAVDALAVAMRGCGEARAARRLFALDILDVGERGDIGHLLGQLIERGEHVARATAAVEALADMVSASSAMMARALGIVRAAE